MDRKRDIFIKLQNLSEIVEIMMEIKDKEEKIKRHFKEVDKLNIQENKVFENWSHNLDDITHRLDHVTL